MPQPVLVAGARTPIGKLLGSLSTLPAPALAGTAIAATLDRAGITGAQAGAVIMGNVGQAGVGPMSVPATTINKLCLSGLTAIALAAQQVVAGQYDVVVAGGVESMSNAPYLLAGARPGLRYGAAPLVDALDRDALVGGFDGISMGAATERCQAGLGISRADQDVFAAHSHARAAAAIKAGRLPGRSSRSPCRPQGRGDRGGRRGSTARHHPGRLAALPPAFSDDGTITAGSASQLSDGACAVVQMSKDRAGSWTPLARRARQLRHRRRPGSLPAAPAGPTRSVPPCGETARSTSATWT